jgi:hypothetical protein
MTAPCGSFDIVAFRQNESRLDETSLRHEALIPPNQMIGRSVFLAAPHNIVGSLAQW